MWHTILHLAECLPTQTPTQPLNKHSPNANISQVIIIHRLIYNTLAPVDCAALHCSSVLQVGDRSCCRQRLLLVQQKPNRYFHMSEQTSIFLFVRFSKDGTIFFRCQCSLQESSSRPFSAKARLNLSTMVALAWWSVTRSRMALMTTVWISTLCSSQSQFWQLILVCGWK